MINNRGQLLSSQNRHIQSLSIDILSTFFIHNIRFVSLPRPILYFSTPDQKREPAKGINISLTYPGCSLRKHLIAKELGGYLEAEFQI